LMTLALNSKAQVDAYSQFYNTDMAVNPALTGLMESKWRIQDVFRRQFKNVDSLHYNNYFGAELMLKFKRTYTNYIVHVDQELNSSIGLGVYTEDQWGRNHYVDGVKAMYQSYFLSIALHKAITKKSDFSVGLQPGLYRSLSQYHPDANIGVLYGFQNIFCWREDQLFKTQIGISAYHVLQDFVKTKDTVYHPVRRLQAHGGILININKVFGLYPNFHLIYDGNKYADVGVSFYYLHHQRFWDRLRFGTHYRTTQHLVFSGGIRLFPDKEKSLVYELTASYDLNLHNLNVEPYYRNGFDIGITIYPFQKCWSLNKCVSQ